MRQFDHLPAELTERLNEFGKIRDALEPAEAAGDFIFSEE